MSNTEGALSTCDSGEKDAVSAGREKPRPAPAAAQSKCDRAAENLSVLIGKSEEENAENTEHAAPCPASTKSDGKPK
jgi:hypothetical protein